MSRLTVGAACLCLATGCYSLQAVPVSSLADGKQVAFDVSDAGRVALGGSMGPTLAQIEGRLVRQDSGEYVVAVSSVRYLTGGTQVWSGEPVRLKPEHLAVSYQKRFSKSRTLAAGAIGVGAVAFIVTRSIVGDGNAEPSGPGGPTGTALRGPRP